MYSGPRKKFVFYCASERGGGSHTLFPYMRLEEGDSIQDNVKQTEKPIKKYRIMEIDSREKKTENTDMARHEIGDGNSKREIERRRRQNEEAEELLV